MSELIILHESHFSSYIRRSGVFVSYGLNRNIVIEDSGIDNNTVIISL